MEKRVKKILLIHGYGTGTEYPIIGRYHNKLSTFGAFRKQLLDGSAQVFYWDTKYKLSILETLNIFNQFKIYREEREKATRQETLEAFHQMVLDFQPEILVFHSLGVYLFWQYQFRYEIPAFVKKIVWVQGDLGRTIQLTNSQLVKRIEQKEVQLINCFCPWDYTLPFSGILNRQIPVGLLGSKAKNISNKLFPLYRYIHLHESSIRDPLFGKFVMKED